MLDLTGPIVFDECLAIMQERSKLYASYRADIRRGAAAVRAALPEQSSFEIAARAYIERVGEKIFDRTTKAHVQKLAQIEFGVLV